MEWIICRKHRFWKVKERPRRQSICCSKGTPLWVHKMDKDRMLRKISKGRKSHFLIWIWRIEKHIQTKIRLVKGNITSRQRWRTRRACSVTWTCNYWEQFRSLKTWKIKSVRSSHSKMHTNLHSHHETKIQIKLINIFPNKSFPIVWVIKKVIVKPIHLASIWTRTKPCKDQNKMNSTY